MDLQLDVELQGLEVWGLRGFLGISTLGFRVCIVGVAKHKLRTRQATHLILLEATMNPNAKTQHPLN